MGERLFETGEVETIFDIQQPETWSQHELQLPQPSFEDLVPAEE
jgi:hypothetical protein